MNKRYGLKEVANVIFFDIATGKPEIFFDTLKVSSIENESETAEARGGQGNNKLLAWDFGRTANLTMQDALLSDHSLAMLAGTAVKKTGIRAVGREQHTVGAGLVVTLEETPAGDVTVYLVEDGLMGEEVPASNYTEVDGVITFTAGVVQGDDVMVFFEYDVTDVDASQITFSGRAFPKTYRVVGETIVRGQDGIDRKMQFHIAKAKLQSSFSLTMDVENVSTFDFNLEILVDTNNKDFKLYDIIRL